MATIARQRGLDPGDIEIWFGDEARIGQKNEITRRWARRGSRPSAPSDQRTASTYIFGAICPKAGKAVGLTLPWCNTAMMNLHLAAISADVAPGCDALLLADQAGWHLSRKLVVPTNITIVPLPPKCPELNPQENVWQFVRDNWLSNHVCLTTSMPSSTIAAMLGTSWRLSPEPLCPSACATGLIGSDQRVLVLI